MILLYALCLLLLVVGNCVEAVGPLCAPTTDGLNLVIPHARPPAANRKFNSTVVEAVIQNVTGRMKDKQLAVIFANCFPNTLDTTVIKATNNDSFVITGDIDAMWLRDSTNQVLPYVPFLSSDPALITLFTGLVRRELRCIIISTYADAYNEDANGHVTDPYDFRKPPLNANIFEGKYELDQMCAAMKLTYETWQQLRGTSSDLFGDNSTVALWAEAMGSILTTMENQTLSTEQQNGSYPYEFVRAKWPWKHPDVPTVYPHNPVAWTGMVRSAFRPSDDLTEYDFLVPSNAMAVVSLRQMRELLGALVQEGKVSNSTADALGQRIERLIESIEFGIASAGFQALVNSSSLPVSLAYEADGFGRTNNMDDANVPSLLSLPFIGYSSILYNATRTWVLSPNNPWFFNGTLGCGIGSPHTGPDSIWPMSVMMRAMTSTDDAEIMDSLTILKVSANATGFMHESFNMNNVTNFTRPWFAWANTMFGQLILHVADTRPYLIFDD